MLLKQLEKEGLLEPTLVKAASAFSRAYISYLSTLGGPSRSAMRLTPFKIKGSAFISDKSIEHALQAKKEWQKMKARLNDPHLEKLLIAFITGEPDHILKSLKRYPQTMSLIEEALKLLLPRKRSRNA